MPRPRGRVVERRRAAFISAVGSGLDILDCGDGGRRVVAGTSKIAAHPSNPRQSRCRPALV